MHWQDFLLRYLCLYRLKCLGEKDKNILLIVFDFPTSGKPGGCYRKGMFCFKCRITGNKNAFASQRHIDWDNGYIDGSPVSSMVVLKSEGNLKRADKGVRLDSRCLFTEVLTYQEDSRNLDECQHCILGNRGSYKSRF